MQFQHENDEIISSLRVHEWLAIALVIGVLGGLACLTTFNRNDNSTLHSLHPLSHYTGFDVFIKGAVNHPGVYHLQSEMKMKDVLKLAEISSNADIRRFNLETIVKKGRVINVPTREMITVTLKGAVNAQQVLTLPKSTKLEDIIALGTFAEDADLNALKKKRRLKANEIVNVPFLK